MKQIIYLLVFLFLVGVVTAPAASKTIQTIDGTDVLTVRTLGIESRQINHATSFKVHVFNSSGMPLNTGVSCYFHLYNTSENHVAELVTTVPTHDWDYEFSVGANNLTKLGAYAYIMQCNTSTRGGFTASAFDVTLSGQKDDQEDSAWISALLIIPMLLAFYFIYWANSLPEEQEPLKWFSRLFSIFCIFMSFVAANIIIGKDPEYSGMSDVFNITAVQWIFYTVISVFALYFMYKIFTSFKQKDKDDFERGVIK